MSRVIKGKKRKKFGFLKTIFTVVFFLALLTLFVIMGLKYFGADSVVDRFLPDIFFDNPSKVVSIKSSLGKVYLAVGGTKKINISFEVIGEPDKTLTWTSKDENIASVSDEVITGVSVGNTQIEVTTSDGVSTIIDVVVTDLITVPTIGISSNRKPYLPCGRYTEEEAQLLDEILFARVSEAGEGTRGGAVAAARFLLLEFPYEVRYFNENGRMNGGYARVDAEGRFYHKGLYLSESKFSQIKISTKSGPAIWGCNLYDNMLGQYRPNGLTCSGFVSWALYNGGLDVGDVGAGDYPQITNELSDMGPHQEITYEFMASDNYKVGDFIARDGHAALIIGLTEDKIYTAESLIPGVEVHIYDRYKGIVEEKNPNDKLTYIINMDTVYPNGEGIYADMWSDVSTIN